MKPDRSKQDGHACGPLSVWETWPQVRPSPIIIIVVRWGTWLDSAEENKRLGVNKGEEIFLETRSIRGKGK